MADEARAAGISATATGGSFFALLLAWKAVAPASGALLSFTNVTAFRGSIEQAIYEREYTKTILNTVIGALVVLDADLRVQTANRAFFDLFGLSRENGAGDAARRSRQPRVENVPTVGGVESGRFQ